MEGRLEHEFSPVPLKFLVKDTLNLMEEIPLLYQELVD